MIYLVIFGSKPYATIEAPPESIAKQGVVYHGKVLRRAQARCVYLGGLSAHTRRCVRGTAAVRAEQRGGGWREHHPAVF